MIINSFIQQVVIEYYMAGLVLLIGRIFFPCINLWCYVRHVLASRILQYNKLYFINKGHIMDLEIN